MLTQRRSAALLACITTVALVVGPLGPPAQAAHPANSCLDVTPETSTNTTGTAHAIAGALLTNTQSGCNGAAVNAGSNLDVFFEITGPNDPDNGNTPASPDLSCRMNPNDSSCAVSYTGTAAGTDTILGWIDHDGDNVLDTADPQDSVTKTWQAPASTRAIDCDDASGDDTENNPTGQSETYTCSVTDPDGTDAGTARDPVANARVDAENLNGANDPDNSAAAGTADFNNACTTAAAGTCQFVLAPSEQQAGTALVCFWVDTDNDGAFDPAGAAEDGAECDTETAATEDTDLVDVVQKTWQTGPSIDCDDESGDDNQTNASTETETYSCTVTTDDGADQGIDRDPIASARIDYENLNGVNDPDNSAAAGNADANDACITGTAGTCTVVVSPSENQVGTAIYCFWYDSDSDAAFAPSGAVADGGGCTGETAATEDVDVIDAVSKTWIAAMSLDCDDESGDDSQINQAGQSERYDCTLTQPDGSDADTLPDPAANVKIDGENLNGPNDPDNSAAAGTADYNDGCTTSSLGKCSITIAASENESSTATICFWADGDADTAFAPAGSVLDGGGCAAETAATEDADEIDAVAKTWAFTDARTITCSDDLELFTGFSATIGCVLTDRFNAPVQGESVTFSSSGPGSITSPTSAISDANGAVSVTVTSGDGGPQVVTATITDDLSGAEPAEVDDCDRAANDPAGSTAGRCADSTTVMWEKVPLACATQGAIIGTEASETLTGTSGDDILCGLEGNDTINGLGGDDIIFGGAGNDTATGGKGRDAFYGASGNDRLSGGANDDQLRGQQGRDTLLGGRGDDTLRGGADRDVLHGGPGRDFCTDPEGSNPSTGCET